MRDQRSTIDIETLRGAFTITFLDYDSDQYEQYVITKDINQLQEIKEKLKKVNYFIGFNSIHFDSIVCNWLINQKETTPETIYKVAQAVINQEYDYDAYKQYSKYKYNTPWINLDLFMYWSKMLRISKKLSLKYFANNMDMDIQEMPIHHTRDNLTEDELQQILIYNLLDCHVTRALAKKSIPDSYGVLMKDKINLRLDIGKTYNLDAISWDSPKIASELLLDSYCKKTYEEKGAVYDISFYDYKTMCRNLKTTFESFRNGDYIPEIKFKTKVFQDLYKEICDGRDGFSKEIVYKQGENNYIKISYGSGGVHSVNKNEEHISKDGKDIWSSDVASLYPTLLENYKFINPNIYEVLEIYSEKKKERIIAKKEGNKGVNEILKLVLNATTGLLDNTYSWLYSPGPIMGLRLTGQLVLTRLLEECTLNNFSVISMNTDGIELIVPKERDEAYLDIISTIEEEFNLEFEHTLYKSIRYKSVNDYIAVTNKDKIKVKGEFIYEKILDGSNEFLIIPIAVKEYFVNNIPIEQTIRNHKNIFDFCAAKKIDRTYSLFYLDKPQQQLNRFYCSKKGAYLYKQKKTKNTREHVFKESAVIIMNTVPEEFPLDIDYSYYITAARNRLKLFEKEQLNLFS